MTASYADVRDFAISGEGPCCTDGGRLEDLMREVLWVLWSSLPAKDRQQLGHFDTVADQQDYTIAGGTARISNLSFGSCHLVRREEPCNPCGSDAGTGPRGKPVTWSITIDDKVRLSPIPDDVYRVYYRKVGDLDTTLYTEVDSVRTWAELPFPEAYHAVYKTMVRAKAVLEADPARGVMLYNSALSNFRTIVADRIRDFEGDRTLILNRDARRRNGHPDPDSAFRWALPSDYVFTEF